MEYFTITLNIIIKTSETCSMLQKAREHFLTLQNTVTKFSQLMECFVIATLQRLE